MRRLSSSSAISAVVSLLSLGAVAWWISRQSAPELPDSRSGYALLVFALGLAAVNFGVRSWRWHEIMRLSAVPHRTRDAAGLTLVGYMGNNVLPARGGELLKIGLLGSRTDARRRDILGTVVVERTLDAVVLAVLFVVLTYAGVRGATGERSSATLIAAALGAAMVVLGAYLWLRRRGRFERFAEIVRPVATAARSVLRPAAAPLVAASVLIWCVDGLTFLLIARSVDADLGLLPSIAVVVLASLAAAIPAAPGYVGTFDAGILLGLHAAGVQGGEAVSVLLLARFMLFVPVTLVGLGVLLVGYGGLSRLRALRGGERPEHIA